MKKIELKIGQLWKADHSEDPFKDTPNPVEIVNIKRGVRSTPIL